MTKGKGRTGLLRSLRGRLWGSRREVRQQSGYSDAILNSFLAYSEGTAGRVSATGALEACAGLWSRAFASAAITPATAVTQSVTPSVLGLVGRDLIRRGESLHEIRVSDGRVRLIPVGSWSVHGSEDPESWIYQSTTYGASTSRTRWLPASAVIHIRFGYEPERPEIGIGPMEFAKLTGDLAANLELRLGEEAGGPVGHILPIPSDGGDGQDSDPLADLKRDLGSAKGRTLLGETTSAGWGDGAGAAPRSDWTARRFGASPPDVLPSLRTDAALAVAASCGVPPMLFEATGSGPLREAWRQFLHGSVLPLSRVVESELSDKLDTPVKLDFKALAASDIMGRARAFQSLTKGGLNVAEAAQLAGLRG